MTSPATSSRRPGRSTRRSSSRRGEDTAALSPTAGLAQELGKEVVDAAKREGKVVIYGSIEVEKARVEYKKLFF